VPISFQDEIQDEGAGDNLDARSEANQPAPVPCRNQQAVHDHHQNQVQVDLTQVDVGEERIECQACCADHCCSQPSHPR
jgi:hypothetical protein